MLAGERGRGSRSARVVARCTHRGGGDLRAAARAEGDGGGRPGGGHADGLARAARRPGEGGRRRAGGDDMTRDGGHRNLSVDASVGDQKSVARRRRGPRQRGKSRCEPPDSERRAGGGRGISREAPPRCRASSQSALQKMPKISENQETIRIRRNPLAGASPEKLRFFIRLDAFFSYRMCSRWKRSSSIHAGTSGAPERSRCYGVRRCGAPPLRCVTNARSNPEKQTARRIEARPGRPPPRAAPPPHFLFSTFPSPSRRLVRHPR